MSRLVPKRLQGETTQETIYNITMDHIKFEAEMSWNRGGPCDYCGERFTYDERPLGVLLDNGEAYHEGCYGRKW